MLPPSILNRMAWHSAGSFAFKLVGVGSGFLFAVASARLLGAAGFGTITVAISMASVVATIALLGANGYAVRQIAASEAIRDWSQLRTFIRWAVKMVLVASAIAAAMMAAISFVRSPYSNALILGALLVPLLATLHLLRGVVQGAGHVVTAQVPMELIRWLVILALIGFFILIGGATSQRSIMIMVLVGHGFAVVVAAITVRKYLAGRPSIRPAARQSTKWLAQSIPFLLVAAFGIIGTEISTLLLGWLASPREAGLYQPIARLSPLMLLANDAIEAALAPRMVRMWEHRDTASLQRLVRRAALVSTFATAMVAAAILLLSPYILRAFGREFVEYRPLLTWIAGAQVINAATGAAPLLLAMTGDNRRRIGAQAVTLIVQAGLGIALVPIFGAAGAVASLVAAIVIWSVLHWWLAQRATNINTSIFSIFERRE